MPDEKPFWQNLFATGTPEAGEIVRVEMRQVRKRGQPLLLLPKEPVLARQVLELYPAQSRTARFARAMLRRAMKKKVRLGTRRVILELSTNDPFIHFVANSARYASGTLPVFGILAGNARSAGQRFIILVFDLEHRPVAVVKAGLTPDAQKLIDCEREVLESASREAGGVPKVFGVFEHARIHALAMRFYAGRTPLPEDESDLPRLLRSWIRPHKKIALSQTRVWQELEYVCEKHPLFEQLTRRLQNRFVHATIYHGDFAPWNIKVSSSGNWTVLDWERGEVRGLPGWDWIHYVVQTGLLVERQSTRELVERLENFCESEPFKDYSRLAGFSGFERPLALAYLLHHTEVIQPSEGLKQSRALLKALCERWLEKVP
jgi:hypothetical protein